MSMPWTPRLSQVWRMRDPDERDASLALRAVTRQPAAPGGEASIAPSIGCTPAIRSRWPPTRCDAYLADRAAGKDALLVCDTWEMADALNRRLHDTSHCRRPHRYRRPATRHIRIGDLIISRNNNASHPRTRRTQCSTARPDQVRNGNRWRVARHRRRRPTASPPNSSPIRHASCSKATICVSMSAWAMPSPCIPHKASPPTPRTPSSPNPPAGPWPTWPWPRPRHQPRLHLHPTSAAKPPRTHHPGRRLSCTCCGAAPNTPRPTTSG